MQTAILQEGVGMAIIKEVLDELLKEYRGPDEHNSPDGLLKQLTKVLIERSIEAELTEYVGYEKHDQIELNVSPELISRATDSLKDLLGSWRNRSLAYFHGTCGGQKWSMPIRVWGMAMHQFRIFYGDRVSL